MESIKILNTTSSYVHSMIPQCHSVSQQEYIPQNVENSHHSMSTNNRPHFEIANGQLLENQTESAHFYKHAEPIIANEHTEPINVYQSTNNVHAYQPTKCRQQPNGWESGYCVMMAMHDIVISNREHILVNKRIMVRQDEINEFVEQTLKVLISLIGVVEAEDEEEDV
ncbi:hypothetical protein QVD17_39352 [Tagetes erecta]|uniref:Uncharacterized protein n=1 Tax=Tagetes erecta TaxID=13708 RepID=A0AAD8JQF2_TARER|nr:hypothetical protein QVD17_39352 [Tagetes erecta]